jgi:alpha-tubulin suppressor-like RCC1 family protein
MSACTVRCSGARRPCPPALPTLLAAALAGLLACGEGPSPTEPNFKPAPTASFNVSPTALQFIVPGAAAATLTVTSKTANTISAASSSTSCLVSPASAALTKPRGMMDYTGTFTVTPSAGATGPGACTITLADKKGGQKPVAVTLVASPVHPRRAGIAAGFSHACALDESGAAWCWGWNQDGSIGDGTTTSRSTPVQVTGGLTFTSLTAGSVHICGLTSLGKAYCWGNGGQVGDGTTIDRTVPTAVAGGLTFIQVAASGNHTCGLTAAGQAYCWGVNAEGQLGDATFTDRLVPTLVANAVGGSAVIFASLEAGAEHTCGLTNAGKAYCWGSGKTGQTGDGTFGSRSAAPKAVTGTLSFTELTARNNSTCGLIGGGALYCWGSNVNGTLADGDLSFTPHASPTPSLGGPFAALAAGGTVKMDDLGTHTCALTAAGAAYCWGVNAVGQGGDGTTTYEHETPTAVTGPGGSAPLAFAGLSTGMAATCGITTDHAIYCWGNDDSGALGSGQGNQSTPTLVRLGAPSITSVTLDSYTIAIEGSTIYHAALFNPGLTLTGDVSIQGYITQGTTNRAAGGTSIRCSGEIDGTLPPGSCTSSFSVTVSNSVAGTGTLVPGPATLHLDLYNDTATFDSETVPITLQ